MMSGVLPASRETLAASLYRASSSFVISRAGSDGVMDFHYSTTPSLLMEKQARRPKIGNLLAHSFTNPPFESKRSPTRGGKMKVNPA
jgi:hypothetical protein